MIPLDRTRSCSPEKQAVGVQAFDFGLDMGRKAAALEFFEVPARTDQRIIASEEDAAGTDDFDSQSINLGSIKKRGSCCIVKDVLGDSSDLGHELVEEETTPPMG